MNKLLLLAAMLFALSSGYSQIEENEHFSEIVSNEKYLTQIQEVYSQEFLNQNPDLKAKLIQMLEERVSLKENVFTGKNFPLLSSLQPMNRFNPAIVQYSPEQFSVSSFNPLWYSFGFFEKTDQYYIVDGTSYVLFIQHYKPD